VEARPSSRATPLYSEQGNVTGATIVLQDVTRLLRFDELRTSGGDGGPRVPARRSPRCGWRCTSCSRHRGPLNEKQLDLVAPRGTICERLQGIVEDCWNLSRIQGRQGRGLADRAAGEVDPRRAVARRLDPARDSD